MYSRSGNKKLDSQRLLPVDSKRMAECLHLASKGAGYVSPNPLVGAVLVKNNRIVARGYHKQSGGPHAEVECLRRYHGNPRGAILYVNLEPCCHFGKTPPCTDLIINSGIKRVVVATKDPNPIVEGKGIRKLRRAGISVDVGTMEAEARQLNRMFFTYITQKRPYIHVKIAQTLDGTIAALNRQTALISSHKSRVLVHRWRGIHDAVLVGAGTIAADDPILDTRLFPGRDPAVVILDGGFNLPERSRVLRSARGRNIFVFVDGRILASKAKKAKHLHERGVKIIGCKSRTGKISLQFLLKELHKHDIASILVEGGRQVFTQFVQDGCLDQLSVFIAPWLMGAGLPAFETVRRFSGEKSLRARETQLIQVGSDFLIQAYF